VKCLLLIYVTTHFISFPETANTELIKNFSVLTKPKDISPSWEKLNPHHILNHPIPLHIFKTYFSKINFDVILPTARPPKWSIPMKYYNKTLSILLIPCMHTFHLTPDGGHKLWSFSLNNSQVFKLFHAWDHIHPLLLTCGLQLHGS
jgi:hypothetical protein